MEQEFQHVTSGTASARTTDAPRARSRSTAPPSCSCACSRARSRCALGELADGRRPAQEHRLAAARRARAPGPGRAGRRRAARFEPGPGDPALRPPRHARAPPGRAGRAVAGGAVRGERGDDQPRRPDAARRRAPRAGREPPLPRRRPVGRAPRRLPLHRQRQGAARVRRAPSCPRRRWSALHAAHDRRPRRARAPSSSSVRRDGCATAIDELEVGLAASPRRCAAPTATWSPRSASPARRCA